MCQLTLTISIIQGLPCNHGGIIEDGLKASMIWQVCSFFSKETTLSRQL